MEKERSIEKNIKETIKPIKKMVGFGITHFTERLSRKYGKGTFISGVLGAVRESTKRGKGS